MLDEDRGDLNVEKERKLAQTINYPRLPDTDKLKIYLVTLKASMYNA